MADRDEGTAIAREPRFEPVDRREVEERLRSLARVPNPWSPPLVNVLEANLELDASFGTPDIAR